VNQQHDNNNADDMDALSTLVALVSLTLVAGQSMTAPTQTAANGNPMFPATLLVSELFLYTALVHIFSS